MGRATVVLAGGCLVCLVDIGAFLCGFDWLWSIVWESGDGRVGAAAGFSFAIARGGHLAVSLAVGLLVGTAAMAQETVTYSYDALGRVTASSHSGSVNSGLQQQYSYDKADNRTNVTVSGSAFTGGTRVLVVPLKGLTIIPLGNGQ